MKNRNNRGFTLIEMLAVIAVIAILVSVIVPKVTKASDKAAAAADAANLRSAKADIATMLLDTTFDPAKTPVTAKDLDIPPVSNYKNLEFKVEFHDDDFTVYYGTLTIADLSDIADNGEADQSNAASQTVPTEAGGG